MALAISEKVAVLWAGGGRGTPPVPVPRAQAVPHAAMFGWTVKISPPPPPPAPPTLLECLLTFIESLSNGEKDAWLVAALAILTVATIVIPLIFNIGVFAKDKLVPRTSVSKASLEKLHLRASEAEIDVFKGIFRGMAECNDGRVRQQSFDGKTIVKTHDFVAGVQGNKKATRLLSMIGADEALRKRIVAGDSDAINEVFSAMDLNGDGELTWAEWTRYVGKRRIALAKAKL